MSICVDNEFHTNVDESSKKVINSEYPNAQYLFRSVNESEGLIFMSGDVKSIGI